MNINWGNQHRRRTVQTIYKRANKPPRCRRDTCRANTTMAQFKDAKGNKVKRACLKIWSCCSASCNSSASCNLLLWKSLDHSWSLNVDQVLSKPLALSVCWTGSHILTNAEIMRVSDFQRKHKKVHHALIFQSIRVHNLSCIDAALNSCVSLPRFVKSGPIYLPPTILQMQGRETFFFALNVTVRKEEKGCLPSHSAGLWEALHSLT